MNLPLAERDLHLLQIEAEIKNKKKLLVKKKKDLDKNRIKVLTKYFKSLKKDLKKAKKAYENFMNFSKTRKNKK